MGLRKLRTLGDEMLRRKCRSVERFDDRLKQLVDDMTETMYFEEGAGLAASQIGILKRVVVIDMGDGLKVLINPKIVSQSGEQEVMEACLSVPNRTAIRKRPAHVVVEAQDVDGKTYTIDGVGDYAKCLCHEIDHLDGILYIDNIISYIEI
ncbi:MAG: peptide deformylase [Clostridiales bacterium]|jgi:peptide deformylase|nr:peptide deformylase [Clostridiales bacterium]MDN5297663.1 peptide deformylase [Clostridiales bacterium]